jgi:hypothetical protein
LVNCGYRYTLAAISAAKTIKSGMRCFITLQTRIRKKSSDLESKRRSRAVRSGQKD